MDLKIETRQVDTVTILSCRGRIVFGEESGNLRDAVTQLMGSSHQILLDLSGVNHVDSGGLATLVSLNSAARAAGAEMKLTGVGTRLHDVLQTTRLDRLFQVYGDEQQALAAFKEAAAKRPAS
ncbi:MAG TPA: STAS domain-containing protein [Candidatus Angelobacter sp.]|jgi:anti-sigma B factor antagonist|nr:STAS domain-containing protein [Candidatus Angelobacter sp.]